MYRNCIFCAADLGTNEILRSLPVGRQIAVDAWKGRLWIICGSCARWNLTPIEERWEPVEEAEVAYGASRSRFQQDNIGLACLADGTHIVRIGRAPEGEVAAWRYGAQMIRRRQRFFRTAAGVGAGGVALVGLAWAGLVAMPFIVNGGIILLDRRAQRIVDRIPTEGMDLILRRWHVEGISLADGPDGVELHVRDAHKTRNWSTLAGQVSRRTKDVVVVKGQRAVDMLSRSLVHLNTHGGTGEQITDAFRAIADSSSPAEFVRQAARAGLGLGSRAGIRANPASSDLAIALEMAIHESSERLALMGELDILRRAWAEAEEIAAIADALPYGLGRLRR